MPIPSHPIRNRSQPGFHPKGARKPALHSAKKARRGEDRPKTATKASSTRTRFGCDEGPVRPLSTLLHPHPLLSFLWLPQSSHLWASTHHICISIHLLTTTSIGLQHSYAPLCFLQPNRSPDTPTIPACLVLSHWWSFHTYCSLIVSPRCR